MFKTAKLSAFLVAFLVLFICSGRANPFNIASESPITAIVSWLYGEKVVKISVDNVPEKEGKLYIYNEKSELVYSVASVELIQSPNYTAISIGNFLPGKYTVEIVTKITKYQGAFTLTAE